MRTRHIATLALAVAMLTVVSACTSHHARHDDAYNASTGEWDSGPLDRDYQSRRAEMERRHADEVAHARADESAERREARQAAERQDLEDRYRRAKERHMNRLPDSNDRDRDRDNH